MHDTLTGYRWEGPASLISLLVAAAVLCFVGPSPIALISSLALSVLGVCFGLSYMRTWRRVYRNLVLAALLISAVAFYLALLLPSR